MACKRSGVQIPSAPRGPAGGRSVSSSFGTASPIARVLRAVLSTLSPAVRGTGGAPHAVSRFAGDRRVVAVRPEPRGRLGFGAPLDSACGARRSPGWCRGIACWGGSGWRGPPRLGLWRSPRCLPLCGGPASGRPATRAEGAAWGWGWLGVSRSAAYPRCLPLCGGPASGRPATRAEGVLGGCGAPSTRPVALVDPPAGAGRLRVGAAWVWRGEVLGGVRVALPTLSPALRGTGERSPCDPSRGGGLGWRGAWIGTSRNDQAGLLLVLSVPVTRRHGRRARAWRSWDPPRVAHRRRQRARDRLLWRASRVC